MLRTKGRDQNRQRIDTGKRNYLTPDVTIEQPSAVYDRIVSLLSETGASFRTIRHAPTYTSEQSAEARGEPLRIGAKAILLKIESDFKLFVLSAASRLETGLIRNHFRAQGLRVKKIRFATKEELFNLTGLEPGAVPPFGHPVFDLDLFVDQELLEMERVAFNAGSLTASIVMPAKDYNRAARPTVFQFASLNLD